MQIASAAPDAPSLPSAGASAAPAARDERLPGRARQGSSRGGHGHPSELGAPNPERRRRRVGVSLTEDTYERLVAAIGERRLTPGQPLQQAALARELGVSRTPVREALQLLARDGLAVPGESGVVVAELTVKDVADVLQASSALQALCCRLAAQRGTSAQMAQLEALMAQMEQAAALADLPNWIAADREMDRLVAAMADNRPLARMWATLETPIARVRHLAIRQPGRLQQSIVEHRRVVDAIAARDPDLAERALREHLDSAQRQLMHVLETFVVPFNGERF